MKLHKKIIYILAVAYLFSFVGISSPAISLCICHKKVLKSANECCCCKESPKPHCSCIKKAPFSSAQPVNNTPNADINALYCQTVPAFDLLRFAKLQDYKTGKNQTLIANKNLEMLKTVVLLE